ncbi:hypothetical protein ACPEH1_12660 [Stenotrophomonas sp. NPDC077421]|uniref:hypothetical protein n=1 Tax=Stenotrophomonas sp. NPDC077421 TaxID=3414699 RepID=UPI003C2FDD1C
MPLPANPTPADTLDAVRRRRAFVRMALVRIAALLCAVLLGLCAPPAPAHADDLPRVTRLHGHLELDYTVEVHVDNLAAWAEHNDPRHLVPYIDGRALPGNAPEAIDLAHGRLLFHLRITDDNRAVWMDLLGSPAGLRRPVTFSVGRVDGSPFDTHHDASQRVLLTVISPVYGTIALVLVVLMLAVFVHLARTTSIIRKPGPGPHQPYDLGRFQMAVWFFLIYVSYTAIWLVTDATDTIHASLLALLGISAGTALSEAMIDAGSAQRRSAQHTDPAADPPAAAPVPTPPPARSQGLLHDLLSDTQGYRFDRFQIFAFTLILGVIFIADVYNNLSMPELSPTLLGLMGLSSGTYIGFKFPDRT